MATFNLTSKLFDSEVEAKDIAERLLSLGVTNFLAKQDQSPWAKFDKAKGLIDQLPDELESLKEELKSWKENLPESLQNGSKAEELDTAIEQLDEIISAAEINVDNPYEQVEDIKYRVTAVYSKKGARPKTLLKTLTESVGQGEILITPVHDLSSRSARFADAVDSIDEARTIIEDLESLLPDPVVEEKDREIQEVLEEFKSNLDNIPTEVEFPRMY